MLTWFLVVCVPFVASLSLYGRVCAVWEETLCPTYLCTLQEGPFEKIVTSLPVPLTGDGKGYSSSLHDGKCFGTHVFVTLGGIQESSSGLGRSLKMDYNHLGGVSLIKLLFWSSTGGEIENP